MSDTVEQSDAVAEPSRGDSDTQVYVVTYFNGVTEEATGLEAVRRLLISPDTRVEAAQGEMQGGTYRRKE